MFVVEFRQDGHAAIPKIGEEYEVSPWQQPPTGRYVVEDVSAYPVPPEEVHPLDSGEEVEVTLTISPVRVCTCGSGEPWASCSANTEYCG